MPYIHRGRRFEFVGEQTDYGKNLASEYEKNLWKTYYEDLEKYKEELKRWKIIELKKYNEELKEYKRNLELWNKKNYFYRTLFYYKKPKIPEKPKPPEKPTKPFSNIKNPTINTKPPKIPFSIRPISYYWYHYKSYFYILVLICLIIFSYNHREEISDKIKFYYDQIKIYYDKYFGEKGEEKEEVEIRTHIELINSHYSCYELELSEWPDICKDICEKVAGKYIEHRCTGEDNIYCRCEIETKEYIPVKEEVEEEKDTDIIKGIAEIFESEPISDKTKEIEKLIFEYTNEERRDNDVTELVWDETLATIAREHSLDMVQNDFFAHTNLRGEDPTARAIRNNYNVYKTLGEGWYTIGIAENIGMMPTGNVMSFGYVSSDSESIAKAHVDSWMDSPGHRLNILENQYNRLGVGVAYDGLYYIATQNFF